MSKNRKSAASRLYYTFGTIFLMAVITVCAMNFIQDSRLLNKPAVAASVNENGTVPAADGKTSDGKDGGIKRPETKSAGSKPAESKSTKTKPTKTKPAGSEPAGTSDNSGSGKNGNKPVNPGEEP